MYCPVVGLFFVVRCRFFVSLGEELLRTLQVHADTHTPLQLYQPLPHAAHIDTSDAAFVRALVRLLRYDVEVETREGLAAYCPCC